MTAEMTPINTPPLEPELNTKPGLKPLRKNIKWSIALSALIVVIVLTGVLVAYLNSRNNSDTIDSSNTEITNTPSDTETPSPTPTLIIPKGTTWTRQGQAIDEKVADSDVVALSDGRFRMYYGVQPDVRGNQLEIFSAISSDAINWTKEEGFRTNHMAFPDLVALDDGTWRMYGANQDGIISLTSADGLNFTKESGLRMTKQLSAIEDLNFVDLGAPTTLKMDDGTFMMVFRTGIKEYYPAFLTSQGIQFLIYATSSDGLSWETKGIAVDSRNDKFLGCLDGPDLHKQSDGAIKLYFWGLKGIYETTFTNGTFGDPELVFATPNPDNEVQPPNQYSDPSVLQIGEELYMYYGQYQKGISYAKKI